MPKKDIDMKVGRKEAIETNEILNEHGIDGGKQKKEIDRDKNR